MKKCRVALLVLLSVMGTLGAQEKVRLGLHLEAGRSYGLRMVQEQTVSQTYMGEEQEMSQKMGIAYTFDVEQLTEDGTAWVTATYRAVSFRMESPMGIAEFDSEHPSEEGSPAAQGFGALAGQSIRMQVSAQGRILKIEGVEAVLSRMIEAFGVGDGPGRQELEERLKTQFGQEALMESFGNIMNIYPQIPVAVGESWKQQFSVSQGMPMIFENTWTLRAREGGVATLDLVSEVAPNSEAEAVEMAGMKLRYDMSGRQTGSIDLQESSGWILRGSMALDFQGQVEVEGADMRWPMSVKSLVRFEPYSTSVQ